MRILHVAHALPSDTLGGTELYTGRLAESLARDHEVAVAAPRGDGSRVDVPAYSLSAPARAAGRDTADPDSDAESDPLAPLAVDDPAIDAAFADALAAFEPDVVHFQHLKKLSASLPERCRERGVACVATLHDFWTICHREQLFRPAGRLCRGPESVAKCADCYRSALAAGSGEASEDASSSRNSPSSGDGASADPTVGATAVSVAGAPDAPGTDADPDPASVEEAVGRRAERLGDALSSLDALIAPSSFLRETFVEFGADPDHIRKHRNGILTARFEDSGFDPAGPVAFGYAGRIVPLKGVHLLVDAFAEVEGDAELHVHGEFDPENDPYHARLRERAGDRVRFHGRYDDPSAPYRRVDAFVLPSLWYENSPIVIQEAFASRVPVVTGDVGGMAELVEDGRDGLTFPVGDRAALAERLRRLAADPDVIERLREGIDPPKHLDENTAEMVALYRRCLADAGSEASGPGPDATEV